MYKWQHPQWEGILAFSGSSLQSTHLLCHRWRHTSQTHLSPLSPCLPKKAHIFHVDPAGLLALVWSHLICPQKRLKREGSISLFHSPLNKPGAALSRFHLRNPMSVRQQKSGPVSSPGDCGAWAGLALRMLTSLNGLGTSVLFWLWICSALIPDCWATSALLSPGQGLGMGYQDPSPAHV